MEELWKLESVDLIESRQIVGKLRSRLKSCRDPVLLGELVDFYFTNGSKGARKLLTSLREAHSQDYFDKLNESIQKTSTRLPVLKLLAHTLNSQTSWLYRIVDHPLFMSMLEQLKTSNDIVVLCSALLVVTAILPLIPSYVGSHLQDLLGIFCTLATIKDTKRLGLTPKELCLHLDVAVYYFFLQLYALFPNNLFQYLRHHYGHSAIGEVNKFHESIAPLFYQVQLHPGLITDGGNYELSKSKWGAMEPDDIATLSLQLCLDRHVAAQDESSYTTGSYLLPAHKGETQDASQTNHPANTAVPSYPELSHNNVSGTPTTPLVTPAAGHLGSVTISHTMSSPSIDVGGAPNNMAVGSSSQIPLLQVRGSPPNSLESAPYNTTVLSELPEPSGFKSSEELGLFWSPSTTLGHITPRQSQSSNVSPNESSRSSVNFLTHSSLQPSNISSPLSDSAMSSTLPTPRVPTSSTSTQLFTFKNYSPTASIESESLYTRHPMTQSAVHTPLEDSHSSSQFDPLSQSLMAESSFHSGAGGQLSPVRAIRGRRGAQKGAHNQSFKEKFGRLIGMFVPRTAEADDTAPKDSEGFTEIFVSDVDQSQGHTHPRPLSAVSGPSSVRIKTNSRPNSSLGGAQHKSEVASQEEVGEECLPESLRDRQFAAAGRGPDSQGVFESSVTETQESSSQVTSGTGSNSSRNISEQLASQADQNEPIASDKLNEYVTESIDVPSAPLSSRPSRSNSESSQSESESNGPVLPELPSDYHESGRFSFNPTFFDKSTSELPHSHYSLSFPERGTAERLRRPVRSRNSNSEASTTQTVLMVQERLKELVEYTETTSYNVPHSADEDIVASSTPLPVSAVSSCAGGTGMFAGNDDTPVLGHREFNRGVSTDSNATVLHNPSAESGTKTPPFAGNGPITLSLNLNTSPTKATQPLSFSSSLPCPTSPSTGHTLSNNANNLGVGLGLASRLFVKRVSVCSRKGTGKQFSESSAESANIEPANIPSVSANHPSPVGLLDKYVSEGVMLHKGHFETIPLTELEGVDWNHFGGCPHSEEFGMMQAQVVLLHSQLLFERYQCLQHARRNRTLLSQARSATQVVEELVTLRDQLHKQNVVVRSLQEELQRSAFRHMNTQRFQENLQAKNRTLTFENKSLKDSNLKLNEEVRLLREQNSGLERKLNRSNDNLVSLENDHTHLKSRLQRAEKLKEEVELLSHELQVLGDLYQQQKEQSLRFLGQSRHEYQSKAMHSALKNEKEMVEKKTVGLQLQLSVAQAKVTELKDVVARREEEIRALCGKLQNIQEKYQSKMSALEDKYQSMKVIGLHLEHHVLELKGKSQLVKKKRHKRSSSTPTGVHPPSPRPSTHSPSPHFHSSSPPTLLTH